MKIKKLILIIITFICIISMSVNKFATDNPDPTTDENTQTETNTNNNEQTNNQNQENTQNTQENTQNNDNNGESNNNEGSNTEETHSSEPARTERETPRQSSNNHQTSNSNNGTTNNNSNNINNVNKVKSNNADLRYLKLNVEGLTPEFDKTITEYYLIVNLEVEGIEVEALADDQNARVVIAGNTELQQGENTIEIRVFAEDNSIRIYTIHVTKTDDLDMTNANLKSLAVKGFSFYPAFKNNIYNYNLMINEKVSSLEISAETEIEGSTIEIEGNENLTEGDNLIKIIVTAKNGETKREYKINAYISSKMVEGQKVNKKEAYVLIAVLGVAILTTSIIVLKKKN